LAAAGKNSFNNCVFVVLKELLRGEDMPKLEEVMQMRHNVNGAYTKFCDVVLSQVVGRHDWKQNCGKKLMREYASSSDEAFGLLVLENSWAVWKEMAEKKDIYESTSNKPKYTVNGAGTKKNGGWKQEGIKRFNELAKLVRADRERDLSEFERIYMETNRSHNKMKGSALIELYESGMEKGDMEVYIDDDWKVAV
jgi:hypothetical protein